MKLRIKFAALLGVLALAIVPAMALATQPAEPGSQGKGPNPEANAYGVHCKGESREHVKGEKGTDFSRCVTAMARAAHNENLTPRQACKETSRKHVKGEKGTPFSRCVVAAAQLRKEEQQA